MGLAFGIANCVAWAPGLESAKDWELWVKGQKELDKELSLPKLDSIPAMQRRRLSPFAKVALHCALEASQYEKADIPGVFSSRHGDLHRTTKLIEDVASANDLSPTQFGLSVHNAVSGLYSIYMENHAPISAVAAGQHSFMAGLVDSVAKLHANNLRRILYVYTDLEVPECYQSYVSGESSVGIGMMISQESAETQNFMLNADSTSHQSLSAFQPLDFMQFVSSSESSWAANLNRQTWTLSRRVD